MPRPIPRCEHRPACSGCPRYGSVDPASGPWRQLREFCEWAELPKPELSSAHPTEYRVRSRLAVRGRPGEPQIGLFQLGSHRVIPIPGCPIHHPRLDAALVRTGQLIGSSGLAPYDEARQSGCVRYLQGVLERATNTVQLVVVTSETHPSSCRELLAEIARVGTSEGWLHGLYWNGQPAPTNTIIGPHWRHCHGRHYVEEVLGGARVFFPPGAFGQANLGLFEELASRLRSWVLPGQSVLELYSGVGAIGLAVATKADVTFNEISEASLTGLRLGLKAGGQEMASAQVLPGTAAQALESLADGSGGFDVVIADPPRKGLGVQVVSRLIEQPPREFYYVSCGLQSFLGEARDLLESKRFELIECTAFDFFPFTQHFETLARFRRRPA